MAFGGSCGAPASAGKGPNLRTGTPALQHDARGEVARSGGLLISSPAVDRITELRRLLDSSSDENNPSAEELVELLHDVRHIAVVGLSRHLEKAARRVPSYLAAKGYDVIPVNPNAERLLGRASHASLDDVTDPVDLVLIFRPSAQAGAFVRDALARPEEPAIWLQSGIRADEEARAARAAGRTVVQDLCIFRVHRVLVS